jgi:hypothetical protein
MRAKASGSLNFLMGELSFFHRRRVLGKSGQLGKTNWDAVIRVYDDAGNVIETHEHKGEFQRLVTATLYETQDCH